MNISEGKYRVLGGLNLRGKTESGNQVIAVARCDTFSIDVFGRASFRRSRFNTTSHKILSMATQNCNQFERLLYIRSTLRALTRRNVLFPTGESQKKVVGKSTGI